MTSFEFRETMMGHLLLWGNAYAEIEWGADGWPVALWPLLPHRMQVERVDGELKYKYTPPTGGAVDLADYRVFHLRGLSGDGIVGYSPIKLAKEAIGLGLATEEFGARFFGNDATPGGVLTHPGVLTDDAYDRITKSWNKAHGGLSKSHRMAVLEEGITYEAVGIPPEDAQFLETRAFQLSEIARIYRVPPHMIADLDKATFSNIEHQALEFVTNSLRPWLVRWEQAIARDLFPPEDNGRYFSEFIIAGLLRGDIKSRYEAYSVGRQNGWLSANDVRLLENMNPIEDGDVYLVPLNMIPASDVGLRSALTMPSADSAMLAALVKNGEASAERVASDKLQVASGEARSTRSAVMRQRLQQAYVPTYRDVIARILRREINDVGTAARKYLGANDSTAFLEWMHRFYGEHETFIRTNIAPITNTYIELVRAETMDEIGIEDADLSRFERSYVQSYAARHAGRSINQLKRGMEEDAIEPLDGVEAVFDDWREQRPAGDGLDESVRLSNATSKMVYLIGGVTMTRWVAFGDGCPYCSKLNGQTVGIEFNYLNAGQALDGVEDAPPLIPGRSIGHPPAHRGCDCMIVSA